MGSGWIKLHRKIQDCWIWADREPFDKRSAWIDLLITANHSDKKLLLNGELTTVKRGQILTSMRKLSEKWKWSVNKVYRFIKLLESDGMLQKESNKDRTLLTIINYGFYQHSENTNEYTNETPTETVAKHKQEYKEDKNKKNNKDTICKSNYNNLFEELWKLYSCKKGKGQVSDTAKKRLFNVGKEEMLRAIERYKSELEKDSDWRKPQNGSTFFNSGYVDYLDANYCEGGEDGNTKRKDTADKRRDDYTEEWDKLFDEE